MLPTDASEHATEVKELWQAFGRKENRRVPISYATDEQLWLRVSGHRFREFYTDPKVHLKAQLEGRRWFCENVICDVQPGLPQRWGIGVQHWMTENEFFGCEVVYQEDDYAWAKPLPLAKDDLLKHLADIDPEESLQRTRAYRMYLALKDLTQGMTYLERPVDMMFFGQSIHGIFTKAAEIRGLDQICLDLCDDPGFVRKLLEVVTEKTVARVRAWEKLNTGKTDNLPTAGGFGIADDSLQMISARQYDEFVLPFHEQLFSALTTGRRTIHLCGRAMQHYESLRHKLGIVHIDGPGPFVDHAKYLEAFGPDFSFCAQTNHTALAHGSRQEIEEMLRELLTPGAKQPGRFQVMGYVCRDTPLENLQACYEMSRKHGVVSV
jgi:uroporphyrinogen-III decarboxylase